MLITTSKELKEIIDNIYASGDAYVAMDTEFFRESTYYPELCLVQIASSVGAVVIDVLSPEMNLQPIYDLLDDPKILKVFHSAYQDMEIFFHQNGKRVPHPIFDTQIAAMAMGFPESVGYETLVKSLLGKQVNKTMQYTDWRKRPLTQAHIDYALGDVIFLRDMYPLIENKLTSLGRRSWIEQDLRHLQNPMLYDIDPADAWKRIRFGHLKSKSFGVLKNLAAWRESKAKSMNIPRSNVLKDDMLLELSKKMPTSRDHFQLRIFQSLRQHPHSDDILNIIQKSQPVDPPQHRKPTGTNEMQSLEIMKILLHIKADELGISPRLIATSQDLMDFVVHPSPDHPLLKGWKYDAFGAEAMDLMDGTSALMREDGKWVSFVIKKSFGNFEGS